MAIITQVRKAWNAFRSDEGYIRESSSYGPSASSRPHQPRLRYFNERSIVSSIYTRISIDVAGIIIRHVDVDENDRFLKSVPSSFGNCLAFEPNIDQSPRAFRQDIVTTMIDKGVAAIVAVDTAFNPNTKQEDIYTLRVGEITQWYPKHVRINLYNEAKGLREEITIEKRKVAIVENPLYAVMNEPNSTLQRLIRALHLLDAVDEQSAAGKLDLIIQLPYVIKSEARKEQANTRRKEIEFQLTGSKYGIAYTDGTEKITQLNRPAENNLAARVDTLTRMLYSQLGITEAVMDGTADEKVMLNYFNRTIEPILDAIVEAMQRSFIGPLAKKEKVQYFRDPFKLVPLAQIAEIADKFSRNEILTANEIRGFMGLAPSTDPKADKLINSNMPQPAQQETTGNDEVGPNV